MKCYPLFFTHLDNSKAHEATGELSDYVTQTSDRKAVKRTWDVHMLSSDARIANLLKTLISVDYRQITLFFMLIADVFGWKLSKWNKS